MSVARRERAALVETLRAVGPEAPTLCEGWDARDLVAHLVIREYRLDAAGGIFVPALADYTAKIQRQVAQSTDWEPLLAKVASGPPLYSPFKLLDRVINIAEMFIHHEDIRRAQPDWQPRTLDDALTSALTRIAKLMTRLTLAKTPGRTVLCTPDGSTIASVGKGAAVTVTGDPPELLLFSVGREAHVDLDGDADAIQALRLAPKGL